MKKIRILCFDPLDQNRGGFERAVLLVNARSFRETYLPQVKAGIHFEIELISASWQYTIFDKDDCKKSPLDYDVVIFVSSDLFDSEVSAKMIKHFEALYGTLFFLYGNCHGRNSLNNQGFETLRKQGLQIFKRSASSLGESDDSLSPSGLLVKALEAYLLQKNSQG